MGDFEQCDFSQIVAWCESEQERKKAVPNEEKKKLKAIKDEHAAERLTATLHARAGLVLDNESTSARRVCGESAPHALAPLIFRRKHPSSAPGTAGQTWSAQPPAARSRTRGR